MSLPTMLDVVKRNGSEQLVGLIDESVKLIPEIRVIPTRTIRGYIYKTRVRTAVPTTAGFRAINAGVANSVNTIENRLVECFPLEARWLADKLQADSNEDGAAAYIAEEADGVMKGQLQGIAGQIYYGTGTGGNSAGFPGFINQYDTSLAIDAGGTTATTGSSVWMVRFGPKDVQIVMGNNGMLEITPKAPLENPVLATDPNDSNKQFLSYMQDLTGRLGCQVNSKYSLVRIKKLTADSTHTLTDSMIDQALELFQGGGPDAIFMTKRSCRQLKGSRTATSPTGTPAPWPTQIEGMDGRMIPIFMTEAISNTEALTL